MLGKDDESHIAGVCSGLARYFDMDVAIIRIIFLCLAIFTGVGVAPYIILWIALPDYHNEDSNDSRNNITGNY